MTEKKLTNWENQKFCFNRASESDFVKGLRGFAEYRDLGISEATGGQIHAHVIISIFYLRVFSNNQRYNLQFLLS